MKNHKNADIYDFSDYAEEITGDALFKINVTVKKSPLAQIFPRSNLDIPGQEL